MCNENFNINERIGTRETSYGENTKTPAKRNANHRLSIKIINFVRLLLCISIRNFYVYRLFWRKMAKPNCERVKRLIAKNAKTTSSTSSLSLVRANHPKSKCYRCVNVIFAIRPYTVVPSLGAIEGKLFFLEKENGVVSCCNAEAVSSWNLCSTVSEGRCGLDASDNESLVVSGDDKNKCIRGKKIRQ